MRKGQNFKKTLSCRFIIQVSELAGQLNAVLPHLSRGATAQTSALIPHLTEAFPARDTSIIDPELFSGQSDLC